MKAATAGEIKALTSFFQYAATKYGFYDFRLKGLKPHALEHGLFKKNLVMLRELVEKKGLDLKRFEDHCRFCKKEKRTVEWVTEVLPEMCYDATSMDRNLVAEGETHVHRLLVRTDPPVSSLPIGSEISHLVKEVRVEHKDLFTLGDLIAHYSQSLAVARSKDADKTLAGAFNYLLSNYPLDAILFAIDYAVGNEDYLRSPLMLQETYLPEAMDELKNRKARI